MSTRSGIALLNPDKTVTAIYCHSDGYPEHNGVILSKFYNSIADAKAILAQGDCSILAESIADSRFYNTWRNENTKAKTFASVEDFHKLAPDAFGAEYLYLFDGVAWNCREV
jgi:hypothetical protein